MFNITPNFSLVWCVQNLHILVKLQCRCMGCTVGFKIEGMSRAYYWSTYIIIWAWDQISIESTWSLLRFGCGDHGYWQWNNLKNWKYLRSRCYHGLKNNTRLTRFCDQMNKKSLWWRHYQLNIDAWSFSVVSDISRNAFVLRCIWLK